MKEIKLKKLLNTSRLISSKDAVKLKKVLKKNLKKNIKVVLDFEGIDIAITRFFHEAIGSLYGEFDYEKVDNLISYKNLPESINFMIRKAINSAKKYYKDPEKYKKLDEETYAML